MAEKRRVLVTGSSRGIGKAIAVRLGEQGWSVALHFGGTSSQADDARDALGAACVGVYRCDLSDPEQASGLVDEVLADGPLDALVNNAGVYIPQDFIGASEESFSEAFQKTFSINFESPLLLTRAACRHFAQQGHGKVLNVASRVGFKGESGAALYAASKAALINLTRSLAGELAPKNIQLFGIAPGWTKTAMAREGMDTRLAEILSGIPLGRMASPEDCAAASAFLLSDDASYLSGIVIDINGASYFH
ncbi:MAG: SDR family oxidoreductase [Armatimonadetes bacterium]|nr:SDR family oxidoreductase [Armatimonadota bacterium]